MDASRAGELLQRAGQLYVCETDPGLAQDQYGWQLRRQHGVPFQTLTQEEVRQLEPMLAPIYKHGVLLTAHSHVTNPKKLLEILTAHFIRNGGRMVETKVDGFETAGAKVISLMAGGDRLPVQQVVIAAGSWSGQLSTQLGSPVPLESQRGYHTEFANPGFQLTRTVMSAERKFMATSMEGGLRIAGRI
jgi:D-amino-acid dehydrogenase